MAFPKICLALVLCLVFSSHSRAFTPIAFNFTSVVDTVRDPGGLLGGEISVGQVLSGSFSYDLDVVDGNPADPDNGGYSFGGSPSSALTATNGVFATSVLSGFFVYVGNGSSDVFDIEGAANYISSVTSLPVSPLEGELLLVDNEGTALASDSLPTSFGSISAYETAAFFVSNQDNQGTNDEVSVFSTVTSITVVPESSADFDDDGDKDGLDFIVWQRGFGTDAGVGNVAPLVAGNANGDQFIDSADLVIWQSQYGTISAAASTVPEPASLALALVGLSTALRYRR